MSQNEYLSCDAITRLNPVSSLSRNDLLLVTQAPSRESKSVSYGDMLENLDTDILSCLSVGTMAFQHKWMYSKTDHIHDEYNRLTVDRLVSGTETYSIGRISAYADTGNPRVYDIRAERKTFSRSVEPPIGALKFIYSVSKLDPVTLADVLADDFDGWVYPDGAEYVIPEASRPRFSKALAVYGNSSGVLTVPNLSDKYFESSGTPVADFRQIAQTCHVAEHSHAIPGLDFYGQVRKKPDFNVKTYTTPTGGGMNGQIHYGKGTAPTQHIGEVKFDMNLDQIQFYGLSCQYAGSDGGEYAPRYNALPVMIYIGGVS